VIDQIDLPQEAKAPSPLLEKKPSPFPFFMPLFQETDQILNELYQAQVCDVEGNPLNDFNFLEMPLFPFSFQPTQASIQAILNFLRKPRQLETEVFSDSENSQQLNIPFHLSQFLYLLIHRSLQPRPCHDFDGKIRTYLPPLPIQEVQLIGSAVLNLLQEAPLSVAAQQFFGSRIQPERIAQWFKLEHVKRLFNREGNDYDLRILSPGTLEYQADLSNLTLRYLADSIQYFDAPFYMEKLKSKHPKYQNLKSDCQELKIKEFSLLEFGGVTKRKLVDEPETKYAILGVKMLEDKPTEFLFVGLNENGWPTLKNLNLSTANCWTVSLYHLCRDNSQFWTLKIGSQPFTAAKALTDLICGISTVLDPNVDAWLRYVRNCERSMQKGLEHEMVDNVFKFKGQFLKEQLESKKLSSQVNPKEVSDGEYLYYLLEKELVDVKTKQVNPYLAISCLFRACLSLQTCSYFSDQECTKLWHLADEKGWLQIEDSENCVNQSALFAIKKALIDENVPFSAVSAWMGILTWIYAPRSATPHCWRPVFHLASPLLSLLPIQPLENGQVLEEYLQKRPLPFSFERLYHLMASHHPVDIVSFPLLPHLAELKIEPDSLKTLANKWLTHHSSILNGVGLHLYLQISFLVPDKLNLVVIFQRLPTLLTHLASYPQPRAELLKALTQLASQVAPGYQEALKQMAQREDTPLRGHQWISDLVQTKHPELLILAYSLWKEYESLSPQFARKHVNLGWSLFQGLCSSHPHFALSLLQTLHRLPLGESFHHKLHPVILLIRAYQVHAPRQFACDLDQLLPFIYLLAEQEKPLPFKNDRQRQTFSKILEFCIEAIYQHPFHQTTGDYLFLEVSRHKYLDRHWQTQQWLKRLEDLASHPQKALFANSLYRTLSQEGLFDPSLIDKAQLQQLRITLGEALLQDKQEPLSMALLEKLAQEEIETAMTLPFYNWALHLFQTQAKCPVHECHLQLLDILLLATPPHKRFESQAEFYQFFQRAVVAIKLSSNDPLLMEKFPFSSFDRFLGSKEMIPLMNQAGENWKELLINYLEFSASLNPAQRFPILWHVYEQVMRLFNKTQSSGHFLHLFQVFVALLKICSTTAHSPTPNLLEWMKNKHKVILDELIKGECVKEARDFLLVLKYYQVAHGSLASYIWWVCQKDLNASSILPLLELDSFENIRAQVHPSHYPNLPKLISKLLVASPACPEQAWKWMKWCLSLPDQETVFHHPHMMNQCLTCAGQFLASQNFIQAFAVLTHLANLSQPQLKQASIYWGQIAAALYLTSSAEMNRKLFLNTQVPLICQAAEPQLQPLVPAVIQQHLTLSSPSNLEKNLALDLLESYAVKEAGSWVSLWKALNAEQDADLILRAWKACQVHASALIGTSVEIAHHWTLALNHLYKLNHSDLLNYFHDQAWLDLFQDPLTFHLRWQALEVVFLGAVNALNPSAFDHSFFNLLLQLKVEVSSEYLLQNNLNENKGSDIELVGQWNQTIELALIEKLEGSSQTACLVEVCRLLYSPLKIHLEENKQDLALTYLSHFEKVASAYCAIDIPSLDNLQDYCSLSTYINQIVGIICKSKRIDPASCVALIEIFLNKSSPHLKIASELAAKVLNHETLQLYLKEDQRELYTAYLSDFEKIISAYCTLEAFSPNELESYQALSTCITQTVEIISKSKITCTAPCVPLVAILVKNPMPSYLDSAMKLVSKILEGKNIQEIDALKSSFLTLIPLVIESHREVVKKSLKSAFQLMGLSLKEKCELAHLFLTVAHQAKIKSHPVSDDALTTEAIKLYVTWAPYLFAQSQFLKEALADVIALIIPYASSPGCEQDNQTKFNKCLAQILNVKDRVKLASAPAYQECLQHYVSWVIAAVQKAKPEPVFLVRAFKAYIDEKIDQAASHQMAISEVLNLLDEFCYLYPPQPLIWAEEKEENSVRKGFKASAHELCSRELLIKAYSKGLFKAHPDQLVALELGMNCRISDIALVSKRHRHLFEKIIQKFLDYKTPYSVSRAIQICGLMQPMLAFHELKDLVPIYQKLFEGIRPFAQWVIQHDEFSHDTLFGYLHKHTLSYLPNHPSIRRFITEVNQLYFQFGLKLVKDLLHDSKAAPFQAYYLLKSFYLLRQQARDGVFENRYSSYLSLLQNLWPLVRVIEIKHAYHPTQEPKLSVPNPTTLVQEWIDSLLHSEHQTKSKAPLLLKEKEKKQQREMLFQCLQNLQVKEEGDDLPRLCDSLVNSLTLIFSKPSASYWMNVQQEDAVKLVESIRQTLNTCKAEAHKKLALEFVNIQFYQDKVETDYPLYLQQVSYIIQLIPEVPLIKQKFLFSQFSKSLLKAVLAHPKNQKLNYSSQRREPFLKFLSSMQPIFQNVSSESLAEAQKLLIQILNAGIDEQLLQEDHPEATKLFEWALHWFGLSSFYGPALRLLQLMFYRQSQCQKDLKAYQNSVSALIRPLCESIIQQENFDLSWRFVRLIRLSPIQKDRQFGIFAEWLQTFSQLLHASSSTNKPKIFEHIFDISKKAEQENYF
jgi:hypothetical protein